MRHRILIYSSVLAGLIAGVIRCYQLVVVFEPETGLLKPGQFLSVLLPVFAALFAGVVFYMTVIQKPPARGEKSPVGKLWFAAELTGLFLLTGAAVADIIDGADRGQYGRIVFGVLSIIVVLCMAMLAVDTWQDRIRASSVYGFWATLPVFWACFAMIMNFWNHAGNPVLSSYIFGTLAVISFSLTVFGAAGFYFKIYRFGSTLFYALCCIFLSLLTLAGSFLARYVVSPEALTETAFLSTPDMMRYAFMILHGAAISVGIAHGSYSFKGSAAERARIPEAPVPAEGPPDMPPDTESAE